MSLFLNPNPNLTGGGSGNNLELESVKQRVRNVETDITYLSRDIGKTKSSESDVLEYLQYKADNATIIIDNGKLIAKTLDGLLVTIGELNHLSGVSENIQAQMNVLKKGMRLKGEIASYSALTSVASPQDGDTYVVKVDETHSNTRVLYSYDSGWVYMGEFNYVPEASVDVKGVIRITGGTPDAPTVYDSDRLGGQPASNYTTKTEHNTHVNNEDIHVTTEERESWNDAVSTSHIHENKEVIDNLSEDNGVLLYNGEPISGGTEFNGNIDWSNVENKPTTYPPSEHYHDEEYYTKTEIDNQLNDVVSQQGKVSLSSSDTPDYLGTKIDNVTLEIVGNELKVKNIDGLTIGIAQLNTLLSGSESNFQNQINNIKNILTSITSGMNYIGKLEDKATLNSVSNKNNGDLAVVLVDETKSNARTMYVYSDNTGSWEFIGAFEFSDEFIKLSDTPSSYTGADGKVLKVDETNKKVIFDDVRWNDIKDKPTSTITQIDSAVSKAHEHSKTDAEISDAVNKKHSHKDLPSLEKLGVNSNNELTIDGTVPIKQHLYVRRSGSDQSIPAGTNLIFDSALIVDGGIEYNKNTGVFTLSAGKRYVLDVVIHISGGYSTIEVRDAATLGQTSEVLAVTYPNPINSDANYGAGGVMHAIIKPNTTKGFVLRATSGSADAKLYRYASTLRIVEI